jgi:zinc protease
MMEVEELDGLRCLVQHHARPMFGITFRVGWADEALPERGLSHLVEHLSLHQASLARLRVNGNVRSTETTFHVDGTPAEAVEFLWSVTNAMRFLPMDRLETEARVLRTEHAGRGASAYGELLANRCGNVGYGLSEHPELGLESPDPARVQAWADRWFTVDNAVLWSTFDLPPDLRHSLGRGSAMPPPTPSPLPWALPIWYSSPSNLVAASFLHPRSPASWMALPIVEQRLHARLRMAQGHSYQVTSSGESWTEDLRYSFVAADCLPDHVPDVRDGFLGELGRLATVGPEQSDLDHFIADYERAMESPDAPIGRMFGRVSDTLAGRATRSDEEILSEAKAVTTRDVRDAILTMLDSAIVQLPRGTEMRDRRYGDLPMGSDDTVQGYELVRDARLDGSNANDKFIVGRAGLSFVGGGGYTITIAVDDCVAVQVWTDGARTWWSRDGLRIFFHPAEWVHGANAATAIDAMTPPAARVTMDSEAGSAYLDEVERRRQEQREAAPEQKGFFTRRRS